MENCAGRSQTPCPPFLAAVPTQTASSRSKWVKPCRARALGIAEELPRKAAKAAKPKRFGVVFWTRTRGGEILLRRRPESGLLGGLMEFPSTPWREAEWRAPEATKAAPIRTAWTPLPGVVRHSFTHFDLELAVWAGISPKRRGQGVWLAAERFGTVALPTLMKKVAAHALRATSRLEGDGERR